jgi:uncharacterized protein YvpB
MTILWQGLKVTLGFLLIAGLLFSSGVFTMLLYAKFTGQDTQLFAPDYAMPLIAPADKPAPADDLPAPEKPLAVSANLDAPLVLQNPELPAGCEVTSLAMLLQFAGINITKMELAAEMPRDQTPIILNADGSIKFWGNPNIGFVGDVTRKGRGYGIYHAGLFPLLKQYIPKAVDLTGQPFQEYEKQLGDGIPVVVWTTIDYAVPNQWVKWDTSVGPIEITFAEHAVLLVGFDEKSVFLNDPRSGKKSVQVDKAAFIASWTAMGKQGLSYTK